MGVHLIFKYFLLFISLEFMDSFQILGIIFFMNKISHKKTLSYEDNF